MSFQGDMVRRIEALSDSNFPATFESDKRGYLMAIRQTINQVGRWINTTAQRKDVPQSFVGFCHGAAEQMIKIRAVDRLMEEYGV